MYNYVPNNNIYFIIYSKEIMSYKEKYIKYKNKYLDLKGGMNSINITYDLNYTKTEEVDKDTIHYFTNNGNTLIVYKDKIKYNNKEYTNNYPWLYDRVVNKTVHIVKVTKRINYNTKEYKIKIYCEVWGDGEKIIYDGKCISHQEEKSELYDISYNDELKPPHEVSFFKEMMRLYLGIMNKITVSEGVIKTDEERKSKGDVNVGDKDITTSWSTLIKKYETAKMTVDIKEKSIKYLGYEGLGYKCFTTGCKIEHKAVHTFITDGTMMVVFDVGTTTSNEEPLIIVTEVETLIKWINKTLDYMVDKNVNHILLCGHSNGMASATIIAYLLTYLQYKLVYRTNPIYYKWKDSDIFIKLDALHRTLLLKKSEEEEEKKRNKMIIIIKSIKISVIGSGGFPVIFKTKEEFDSFYNSLGKRYLHIGLCKNDDTYIVPESKQETFYSKISEIRYGHLGEEIKKFVKDNKINFKIDSFMKGNPTRLFYSLQKSSVIDNRVNWRTHLYYDNNNESSYIGLVEYTDDSIKDIQTCDSVYFHDATKYTKYKEYNEAINKTNIGILKQINEKETDEETDKETNKITIKIPSNNSLLISALHQFETYKNILTHYFI